MKVTVKAYGHEITREVPDHVKPEEIAAALDARLTSEAKAFADRILNECLYGNADLTPVGLIKGKSPIQSLKERIEKREWKSN